MKKGYHVLMGALCAVQVAAMGTARAQDKTETPTNPPTVEISGDISGATTTTPGLNLVGNPTINNAGNKDTPFYTVAVTPRMIKAAYLGAVLTAADPTLQSQLKLPTGAGLVVGTIDEKGPAAAAGLAEHDILYKLDDQFAINPRQLSVLVRTHKSGDEVVLTVIRQAQEIKLTARLAETEQPENGFNVLSGRQGAITLANPSYDLLSLPGFAPGTPIRMQVDTHVKLVKAAYLGTYLSAADATLQSQLKLPSGVGLVIMGVDDKSPAKTAGLRQYDMIYKFGDQLVVDAEQFQVLVRMHKPGDTVDLTVIREAQPLKLTATLVEKEVPALSSVDGLNRQPGVKTFYEDVKTETNQSH